MQKRSHTYRVLGIVCLLALSSGPDRFAPAPASSALPAAREVPRGALPPNDAGSPEPDAGQPVWRDDELILGVTPGSAAVEVAASHGLQLRRPVGPSGLAAVVVPDGADGEALRHGLEADARVVSVDRAGVVYGSGASGKASTAATTTTSYRNLQWHLDAINTPTAACASSVVVAVLDTGVAYERYADAWGSYVAAGTLSGVNVVAPYDFVHDDSHANDDHHHGTHIASLIASRGVITGAASGVSIMPIKVLDANNQGSELDLIDAIYYAVDHHANILNMSLVFADGYPASSALLDALETASEAGVTLVAAMGNDGDRLARYPAASPLVLGVGASAPISRTKLAPMAYSSRGPSVDVLAPGGDATADRDGDGRVDGLLAETIYPGDPSRTGYWMYTGSSQATALVSAAAARLYAAGVTSPEGIAAALQVGADDTSYGLSGGYGGGLLDIGRALAVKVSSLDAAGQLDPVYVSALPYLATDSVAPTRVRPTLLVTALDAAGDPMADAEVSVSFWGSGGDSFSSCVTDSQGECLVSGSAVEARDAAGTALALGFGAAVDAVRADGSEVIARPSGVIFMTDGLHLLTEALDAAGLLDTTLLAWRWDAGDDASLGAMAEAYLITDLSAGTASRPTVGLFTPAAIEAGGTVQSVALDLDAAGLFSDTLGLTTIRLVTLDGAGLFSDTLGVRSVTLAVLDAAGLFSDTLGLRALDVYTRSNWTVDGAGLFSDTLGFTGEPISLRAAGLLGSGSLEDCALGALLDQGGWVDSAGYSAAALVSDGAEAGLRVAERSSGSSL